MKRYNDSNPKFKYNISVKSASDEMLHWCSVYESSKEYYHVEWTLQGACFQFETAQPALMFSLKFGDQ
jgi:hypothetical protein